MVKILRNKNAKNLFWKTYIQQVHELFGWKIQSSKSMELVRVQWRIQQCIPKRIRCTLDQRIAHSKAVTPFDINWVAIICICSSWRMCGSNRKFDRRSFCWQAWTRPGIGIANWLSQSSFGCAQISIQQSCGHRKAQANLNQRWSIYRSIPFLFYM